MPQLMTHIHPQPSKPAYRRQLANKANADLRNAVLLSQHGKAPIVNAALAAAGFAVQVWDAFDTDQLGSFTREITRSGSQLDAALTKAKLACKLSSSRYGIGSEGSFCLDPYLGMLPWNQEIIVWWDAERQYSVHAVHASGDTNHRQARVKSLDEALNFASKSGFPEHALIVGQAGQAIFRKGIQSQNVFIAAVEAALNNIGEAWLETDMRAHMNPRRMQAIRITAELLAAKLGQHCKLCAAPGFAAYRQVPGAPCRCCATPTAQAQAEVCLCPACGYDEERRLNTQAEPAACPRCNP